MTGTDAPMYNLKDTDESRSTRESETSLIRDLR